MDEEINKAITKYLQQKERDGGFPDEWTRYSDTGEEIKDTPRYVALGNSLAVPCAERVFRGIISAIGSKSCEREQVVNRQMI